MVRFKLKPGGPATYGIGHLRAWIRDKWYETDDPCIIAHLTAHPDLFALASDEKGAEPSRPHPVLTRTAIPEIGLEQVVRLPETVFVPEAAEISPIPDYNAMMMKKELLDIARTHDVKVSLMASKSSIVVALDEHFARG